MSLSELASLITIVNFGAKIISQLKNKKKKRKTVPRKTVNRKLKQTKDQEWISKLLTNPEMAIKEMGAEYVVKNREKIIKNIVKRIVDE